MVKTLCIYLFNVNPQKLYCAVARDFPLLFYLIPFIAGQALCAISPALSTTLCTCAVSLIIYLWSFRRFDRNDLAKIAGPLTTGVLLYAVSHRDLRVITFDDTLSYVAKVISEPRHRKHGQSTMELSIVGIYSEPKIRDKPSRQIEYLDAPVKVLCRAMYLPWRNIYTAKKGSLIIFKGNFRTIRLSAGKPFSYNNSVFRNGFKAFCNIRYSSIPVAGRENWSTKVNRSIKSKIENLLGRNENSGLFLSMTIGTLDSLSSRTEKAFKKTGLAHLLVVSGYQVSLIFFSIFSLSLWMLLRIRGAALLLPLKEVSLLLGLCASAIFVTVSGVQGSSLRAAIAVALAVLAKTAELSLTIFNCILVSLFALCVVWPGCFLDPGIQLSYAALLGISIGVGYPASKPARFFLVFIFASLMTSIVVLFWFEQFSVIGFLLNPLIGPAASIVACNGGFAAMALFFAGLDPAGYGVKGIAGMLSLFKNAVIWISTLPGSSFHLTKSFKPVWLAFLITAAAYFALRRIKYYCACESGLELIHSKE